MILQPIEQDTETERHETGWDLLSSQRELESSASTGPFPQLGFSPFLVGRPGSDAPFTKTREGLCQYERVLNKTTSQKVCKAHRSHCFGQVHPWVQKTKGDSGLSDFS